MKTIRERFGDGFEKLKTDGGNSLMYGMRLADCDRDELLAVIAWLGKDSRRQKDEYRHVLNMAWHLHG